MNKWLLLAALFIAGFCTPANAQYNYYPRSYHTYRGPVFYSAHAYLRETTYNRRRFYNLGNANAYLRSGMANTRYFYGF